MTGSAGIENMLSVFIQSTIFYAIGSCFFCLFVLKIVQKNKINKGRFRLELSPQFSLTLVRVSRRRGMAAVSVMLSCWKVVSSSLLCSSCSAASKYKVTSSYTQLNSSIVYCEMCERECFVNMIRLSSVLYF